MNKELIKKRRWCVFLSIIFNYIVPIGSISALYSVFKEVPTHYKVTAFGMILVVIFGFKFLSDVNQYIKDLENVKMKKFVLVIRNTVIGLGMFLVLELCKENIEKLETIAIVVAISSSIGMIFKENARDISNELKMLSNDERQKNNMREVLGVK